MKVHHKQTCKIVVNGRWRGDSYPTPVGANVAASVLKKSNPSDSVFVVTKGEVLAIKDIEKAVEIDDGSDSPKPSFSKK